MWCRNKCQRDIWQSRTQCALGSLKLLTEKGRLSSLSTLPAAMARPVFLTDPGTSPFMRWHWREVSGVNIRTHRTALAGPAKPPHPSVLHTETNPFSAPATNPGLGSVARRRDKPTCPRQSWPVRLFKQRPKPEDQGVWPGCSLDDRLVFNDTCLSHNQSEFIYHTV